MSPMSDFIVCSLGWEPRVDHLLRPQPGPLLHLSSTGHPRASSGTPHPSPAQPRAQGGASTRQQPPNPFRSHPLVPIGHRATGGLPGGDGRPTRTEHAVTEAVTLNAERVMPRSPTTSRPSTAPLLTTAALLVALGAPVSAQTTRAYVDDAASQAPTGWLHL